MGGELSFNIFRLGYGMLKFMQIRLLMRMRKRWVEVGAWYGM
jgi:hypothetical protein